MSVEILKQSLKDKKFTFGVNETLKKLKLGKVNNVFLSKDCNSEDRTLILDYKKQGKINVFELDITSNDIGALCKKQFSISILSC